MRFSASLTLLFTLLFVLPGIPAAAEPIDGIAAIINGEAIPVSELERRTRELASATPAAEAPPSREVVRDLMVERRLQLQRAAALGINAGPADVDRAMTDLMASNNIRTLSQLEDALATEGRTLADLRGEITDQVTLMRLIQREVTSRVRITEHAMAEYYRAHPEEFSQPGQVRLRQIIFTTTRATPEAKATLQGLAAQARAQLTGRESFLAAEAQLRDTRGVITGEAGLFQQSELLPAISDALAGLELAGITQPVELPGGVGLFLVDEMTGTAPLPFDQVADRVRERLSETLTEKRLEAWLGELKRDAFIEIRTLPERNPAS